MRLKAVAVGFRFAVGSIKRAMSQPAFPAVASQCCASDFQENAPPTYAMYETLKDLCQSNADHFKPDDSENGQRLYAGFMGLMDHIDTVWPLVDHVRKVAPSYDFDEHTPGNGYRSFVAVVDSCILHGVRLGRQVTIARETFMFRKSYYTREVEACGQLLASLGTCLHHVHTLLSWAPPGDLFPEGTHTPEELFAQADTINQYCFYGRCLGFQFHPSMRGILKGISICMAGFSEAYYSQGNIINSVWTGGQYVIDPELRARRIVNISQNASVEFCKAFWFLAESEIMQRVPNLIYPSTAVNKIITIPPEEISVTKLDNTEVKILPPDAHIGLQSLNVRLISAHRRQGMVGEGPASILPPSEGLIMHCHGGGFVAQNSKSHEVYLREWASKLNIPILSIDYSLAPRAPFPRAIQEVFYVYCWILKNAHLLGSTAKKIIFVGDSAGGNLNTGACLKILQMGIRPPDGLFLAYTPLMISFVPSPGRLLCLMDPLLPFGFMMRCLKAYACPPPSFISNGKKKENDRLGNNLKRPADLKTNNGVLKTSSMQDMMAKQAISPSPCTALGVSSPSSFEDISASDLTELKAHKSGSDISEGEATLSCESLSSEHKTAVSPQLEDQSEKFVSDFLERYVLESDTDSEGRKVPVLRKRSIDDGDVNIEVATDALIAEHSTSDVATPVTDNLAIDPNMKTRKGLHSRIAEAAGNIVGAVSNTISIITTSNKITKSDSDTKIRTNLDSLIARSPSDEFIFSVPRDPYLSPYWADDDILKKLPPTRIVTVHLDPCLDDCVMFAKKLKRLGVPVGLDVLEGLPHGFLNFCLMCKEANEGSKLCVKRIKELLGTEDDNPAETKPEKSIPSK